MGVDGNESRDRELAKWTFKLAWLLALGLGLARSGRPTWFESCDNLREIILRFRN